MVMPKSSITIWLHVVLSTVACFCHASAAPKNPKPSMLWYFVARSMGDIRRCDGSDQTDGEARCDTEMVYLLHGASFRIESTKASAMVNGFKDEMRSQLNLLVYSEPLVRDQGLQVGAHP